MFNRELKYLTKKITEHLVLTYSDTVEDPVYSRNNICRLQSILRHQLGAPIFRNMIKYSWYKAGIGEEKVKYFNVKEACFTFLNSAAKCHVHSCKSGEIFIQCAECRMCICFSCFYWDYHYKNSCPRKQIIFSLQVFRYVMFDFWLLQFSITMFCVLQIYDFMFCL